MVVGTICVNLSVFIVGARLYFDLTINNTIPNIPAKATTITTQMTRVIMNMSPLVSAEFFFLHLSPSHLQPDKGALQELSLTWLQVELIRPICLIISKQIIPASHPAPQQHCSLHMMLLMLMPPHRDPLHNNAALCCCCSTYPAPSSVSSRLPSPHSLHLIA